MLKGVTEIGRNMGAVKWSLRDRRVGGGTFNGVVNVLRTRTEMYYRVIFPIKNHNWEFDGARFTRIHQQVPANQQNLKFY